MAGIEAIAVVDSIIYQSSLLLVTLSHNLQATLLLQPVGYLANHVDAKGRWGVVEGILLVVGVITQHGRESLRALFQHGASCHYQGNTGRSQVLLDTGINQAELGEIQRTGQNIRGHICNQRHIASFRDVVVLSAIDGVVVANMEISSVIAEFDFILGRDVLEVYILAGGSGIATAKDFCFFVCLGGKAAGKDVVATLLSRSKVQSHHVKLHAGTALNEQNLIVIP